MSIQGAVNSAIASGNRAAIIGSLTMGDYMKEQEKDAIEQRTLSTLSQDISAEETANKAMQEQLSQQIDEYMDVSGKGKYDILAGPENPKLAEEKLQGLSSQTEKILSSSGNIVGGYNTLAQRYYDRYIRTGDDNDKLAYQQLRQKADDLSNQIKDYQSYSNKVFQKRKDIQEAGEGLLENYMEQRGITDRVEARKEFLELASQTPRQSNATKKQLLDQIERKERIRTAEQWVKGGNK